MRLTVTLLFTLFFAIPISGAQVVIDEKYVPKLHGAVKAKFETSLYDGEHRFNVRNARLGARGLLSDYIKYGVQIDFSNQGSVSVLDAYAAYFNKGFELSFGQQQYNFSSDIDRGPNTNMFANRSMLAKFLVNYYGVDGANEFVRSLGSRDIGAKIKYSLPNVPVNITAGAFNGAGINNPEWSNNVNLVAKIAVGRNKGFGAAVSHYNGRTPAEGVQVVTIYGSSSAKTQRIRMWGGELRYKADSWVVEGEYAQRRLNDGKLRLLQAAYVQGNYMFPVKSDMFKYVMPVARWDMAEGVEFQNVDSKLTDKFSAHRATIGVNFGLMSKLVGAEVRLSGEKYFIDKKPSDYSVNRLLQDKFTVEIVISF